MPVSEYLTHSIPVDPQRDAEDTLDRTRTSAEQTVRFRGLPRCNTCLRQDTVNAGVLSKPALAYAADKMGLSNITVTGSHIPIDRNDMKFDRAEGEISKQDEQRILDCSVRPPLAAP
jgi:hypothetical protein